MRGAAPKKGSFTRNRINNGGKMNIALTSVSVNDPIAAYKFYTEKLGFVEKVYMPEMYLAIVVSPDDKDGTALLP